MNDHDVDVIVACLRAYKAHRERPRPVRENADPNAGIFVLQAGDLTKALSPEGAVESLLKDPVRSALRGKVREVGFRAFLRGGRDEMERIAHIVEDAMPEAVSFGGATLDKWWDGIGAEQGVPWTA